MRRWMIGWAALGAMALAGEAQELEGNGWIAAAGVSYIATGGNSDSASFGVTGSWDRQQDLWQFSVGLDGLQTEEDGETVAERLSLFTRGSREIRPRLGLTGGWQGERNRFAGVDFRSTFDAGVDWQTVDREQWKVKTVLAATWTTEDLVDLESEENLGALALVRSRYEFSETAHTTQMARFEPNFEDASDYRAEGRVTLTSDLTEAFALKLGASVLYDNEPVPGFESTDTTVTASIVWRIEALEGE